MKTDILVYKVSVDNINERATILCVTYKIGFNGPNYGAEFYVLFSNFDNSLFRIPDGSHTYTFQEELRIFTTAVGITPPNRQNIDDWLSEKMKEAYGENCNITVEPFHKN